MGILKMPVDPAIADTRRVGGDFPRRQHDLPILSVDPVAINIDIAERIVRADLLELPEGLAQGSMVPDADVVDRGLILRMRQGERFSVAMKSYFDPIQADRRTGESDVVSQERCFQFELVWLDE